MKYVAEYRNTAAIRAVLRQIQETVTRPWQIMEVCGGQTHTIVKYGLDRLLPSHITLVHGPGCPVCVTPLEKIDRAIAIAALPDVIFCSYGDMLRVPGSRDSLLSAKSKGADVRMIFSPLDALQIAKKNPQKRVVFFGVGFETTATPNAMAVYQARRQNVGNFSMLVSTVLVPPAIRALLSAEDNGIQGFLAAGHVCTVMGYEEYEPLVAEFRVPIVVTGFEPLDIFQGVLKCVSQLEKGEAKLENAYARLVRREGNPAAKKVLADVFETTDMCWRGIGNIPQSGWKISARYEQHDAERVFVGIGGVTAQESPLCKSGLVLQGKLKPNQCPAFGKLCTPDNPLGAPMVSQEGACSSYYLYHRERVEAVKTPS